jgi:flavin reductase (DIM6/NTAB) family NADH-FMN oxidoreductase RutF
MSKTLDYLERPPIHIQSQATQNSPAMTGLLKEAMGSFTTGVTVVTTHHAGSDWGMTCNSFNTVSLDPAMVLWSIRKASNSHSAFVLGGGFTINILAKHQKALALNFTSGSQAERFANAGIERLASGRARIDDALAWFDCELVQAVEAGDHDILIGRVLDFGRQAGEGLAYSQRTFGVMQPLA